MTTTTPPLAGVATGSDLPRTPAARVRKRLNTRIATLVSVVIAVVWTVPTFGLLISSFRPEDQIKTTGWWTFFTDPQVTLQNSQDVLFGRSASTGSLHVDARGFGVDIARCGRMRSVATNALALALASSPSGRRKAGHAR